DLVGQFRVEPGVVLDRRVLAGPPPPGELLGQFVDQVVVGHQSARQGEVSDGSERISLSRLSARTCRLLAASLLIPSTSATSLLPSSSKCRRASTSRSSGSISSRAARSRSRSSRRTAAWLGEVNVPTSWPAIESGDANAPPAGTAASWATARIFAPRCARC